MAPSTDPVPAPREPQGDGTPVKVTFIAGWGRSGSTLLDLLLGMNEGLVSVGEIKFLWSRGLLENRPCGCGVPLRECAFWDSVIASNLGQLDQTRVRALADASNRTRTRNLPRMLLPSSLNRPRRDLDSYRDALASLYRGVRDVSGDSIIIDSSKFPSYLFLLQQTPGIDVKVVHLVRDPRAVAHSWATDSIDPDLPEPGNMPKYHPAVTALFWVLWNVAVKRICVLGNTPRMVLRYEDLATAPMDNVNRVLDWLEVSTKARGFTDPDRVAAISSQHTVSGNPARHRRGPIAIELDERWRRDMSSFHQRLVWTITSPLRNRYGYRT